MHGRYRGDIGRSPVSLKKSPGIRGRGSGRVRVAARARVRVRVRVRVRLRVVARAS